MKAGFKSSEFMLNVAVLLCMLANGTAIIDIPWDMFLAVAGSVGVYTASRTFVKSKSS